MSYPRQISRHSRSRRVLHQKGLCQSKVQMVLVQPSQVRVHGLNLMYPQVKPLVHSLSMLALYVPNIETLQQMVAMDPMAYLQIFESQVVAEEYQAERERLQ